MPPRIDLTGLRQGQLVVVRQSGYKRNRPLWECVCDCGVTLYLGAVDINHHKRTCCRECSIKKSVIHGCSTTSRRKAASREYSSWNGARQRCLCPSNKNYPSYGGRGIIFSSEWDDFNAFLLCMGECPEGHTLDRIDVDGNYEPGNCRWATVKVQQNNRRVNRYLTHKGETATATEWSRKYGHRDNYVNNLFFAGHTHDDIFFRLDNGLYGKKIGSSTWKKSQPVI